MSELLNQLEGRWIFGLGLAIGFPLLLVLLSELEFILDRADRPIASSFRHVRTWVLPFAALAVFLRWVVLLPKSNLLVRITESLCWGMVILAIMGIFIGGALTLFAIRAPLLAQGGLFAPISREGSLVLNNLLLTTACAAATMSPLFQASIGPNGIAISKGTISGTKV